VKENGKEKEPIENATYSNVNIIINTSMARFGGRIRLKDWSSKSYPPCGNETGFITIHKGSEINYYPKQVMF